MTRDDILRMAKEADSIATEICNSMGDKNLDNWLGFYSENLAALVAAAEREACEKVCKEFRFRDENDAGLLLAAAIRARGNYE